MISWLKGRINDLIDFIYELKKECTKSKYPGYQETIAHVIAVVISASVIAMFIFLVDIVAKVFLGQLLL